MFKEIEIDLASPDNSEFKKLLAENLEGAQSFEIHIWNEETEEIKLILNFGNFKYSQWEYGKIIEGKVTEAFKSFILSLDKPKDTEVYNKMTPFFSIFLDDRFFSEHYGTEIHIRL